MPIIPPIAPSIVANKSFVNRNNPKFKALLNKRFKITIRKKYKNPIMAPFSHPFSLIFLPIIALAITMLTVNTRLFSKVKLDSLISVNLKTKATSKSKIKVVINAIARPFSQLLG